ncbi:pentapeptide repeat-containing protein [Streptomyces sp. C36]|uniref:pentapeptide repeat-containing protein n=1 Tax=Streptomyces sp. C36 TaxID=3237122 RepID=UPI0034C5F131
MPDAGPSQWALSAVLLVLGAFLAIRAWRMAMKEPDSEPKIEVLAGIGGGLVCGIAVGLSALFLGEAIRESQEQASWRADVATAESIPGFVIGDHNVEGINFSGKSLHDADFHDAHLHGFQFRDADLTGANFVGADLRGANLIGANLQDADLTGAKLDNALLHSANLSHTDLREISLAGTKTNPRTCWPKSLGPKDLEGLLANAVVERYEDDATGRTLTAQDDIKEDGLKGGQRVPSCDLWKNGMRIHPEGGPVAPPQPPHEPQ